MEKEFTPNEKRFLTDVAKHRDAMLQDVEDARMIIKIDQHRSSEMIDSQRVYLEIAMYQINAAYESLDNVIKGAIIGQGPIHSA